MKMCCSWTIVAWLPVLDEKKSMRPTQGYDGDAARNMRLFHACRNLLLKTWPEDTEHARVVYYGDNKARLTHHFVGALLGDMQVLMIFFIFICLSMFIIFVILLIFRNLISGHVNLILHVIAAQRASLNFSVIFSEQICPLLPNLCWSGKMKSHTERQAKE